MRVGFPACAATSPPRQERALVGRRLLLARGRSGGTCSEANPHLGHAPLSKASHLSSKGFGGSRIWWPCSARNQRLQYPESHLEVAREDRCTTSSGSHWRLLARLQSALARQSRSRELKMMRGRSPTVWCTTYRRSSSPSPFRSKSKTALWTWTRLRQSPTASFR